MSHITEVPLYQIIGAPLLALVQAETQAAKATAHFIEHVGFDSSETTGDELFHYGNLKVVTFRYSKLDVGGKENVVEIEVPVLSIVPIPALQIREAQIDFAVEVTSVVELDYPSAIHVPRLQSGADSSLEPKLTAFKAGLAKENSKSAMKISINVGQADTPVGLLTLFRVMEQGITSRVVPETPAPPAPSAS